MLEFVELELPVAILVDSSDSAHDVLIGDAPVQGISKLFGIHAAAFVLI